MEKKRGLFLVGLVFLILIGGNIYTYLGEAEAGVSGFSIKNFPDKIINLNFSTIAFFGQWVLLIIAILLFLRHRRKGENPKPIKVERKKGRTDTDLDSFYKLLKKRGELKLSEVSKAFEIENDRALGWGKILENQNLASLEYPAFSEPEIKIKEVKNGKEEK